MSIPLRIDSFPRAILHIDADAFFASCEQAVHPEWKGRPVITGAERGIVAAASYEAKAKGVSRGTPLWEVKAICPDAIIVPSDYETYSLFSERIFAIIRRFTPIIEEYSIDEAFADITGLQRPMRMSYRRIAQKIKATIDNELGITVSVGLSLSKTLAKIGSNYRKPSGLVVIPGKSIHQFLADTEVEKVWGIGPRTGAYCKTLGITTALDFATRDRQFIERHFTKPHHELWSELNGDAVHEIVTAPKTTYASIRKMKTFTPPSNNKATVFAQLLKNLENACIKARRHTLAAKAMTVTLRTQDFRHVTLCAKLNRASAYPHEMTDALHTLFLHMFREETQYRATNVVLTDLVDASQMQLSLFEPSVQVERMRSVYQAVDTLAARMGKHAVHLAGSLPAHRRSARGAETERRSHRLKGESTRKHLAIPQLLQPVG
jgi:DNA polymerase IV